MLTATHRPACAIVVPVHNEAAAVGATVARLKAAVAELAGEADFEIITVDDASTDGTLKVLQEQQGITLLHNESNGGYGVAIRTGVDHCSQPWILIIDADGTYPVEEIPRLWRELRAHAGSMVVGARHGPGIVSAPAHRFARWLLRCLVMLLTGVMVPDLNSGMRIFPRALFDRARHLLPRGFSVTTTLTMTALYSGVPIRFLPIVYARRVGRSHISPVRDFVGFVLRILKVTAWFEPVRLIALPAALLLAAGLALSLHDWARAGAIGPTSSVLLAAGPVLVLAGTAGGHLTRRARSRRGTALETSG